MEQVNRNTPETQWGKQPVGQTYDANRPAGQGYAGNRSGFDTNRQPYDGNRPAVKQGDDANQIHGYMDKDNIFRPYDESNDHYNEQNRTTFDRNRFGNGRNIVKSVNELRTITAQLKSAVANRDYRLTHLAIDDLETKINEL